jgi:hypothetical protein
MLGTKPITGFRCFTLSDRFDHFMELRKSAYDMIPMKKCLSLLTVVVLFPLFFSCVTPSKKQEDLPGYYSMIYTIGREAFRPIAESHLEENDRVLIVHIGEGSSGIGTRYTVKPEQQADAELDPYSYNLYLDDHRFFIEYLENGFINSFLENGGVGFDRLNLARRMGNYVQWLRDEDIIFNTSRLDYDSWEEIHEEFGVSKVLLYSVRNVVGKGKKNYLSKLRFENPEEGVRSFGEHLEQVLMDEGILADAGLPMAD